MQVIIAVDDLGQGPPEHRSGQGSRKLGQRVHEATDASTPSTACPLFQYAHAPLLYADQRTCTQRTEVEQREQAGRRIKKVIYSIVNTVSTLEYILCITSLKWREKKQYSMERSVNALRKRRAPLDAKEGN